MTKYEVLKKFYGYDDFRVGQEEIVDCLLEKRDALCVMPTGAGKSLCYQIPAILFDGITLVISPLISLMKDQVTALCQAGIPAAFLNSSLSQSQYHTVLKRARENQYKIIYVAPERLLNDAFIALCRDDLTINMIAVDEAHCISQWGQDFRPSYLKITEFVALLPTPPVIGAFTATATKEVKEDIAIILNLNNPLKVATGFNRENLYFEVRNPKDKAKALIDFLQKHPKQSGIIYCSTRKAVESVHEVLCALKFPATMYHAGLPDMVRKENQEAFIYDERPIMIATNAFGMGIDKSNVSFVIHYNMPMSIESYYQEAGRAGRDGTSANCILFYSGKDVRTNQFLIANSEPNPDLTEEMVDAIREKDYERLKYITFYSTTNDCLRAFILKYFGEYIPDYCGSCSSCNQGHEVEDITVHAQKILSCVSRTGCYFGVKMIVDVLRGSKNERLLRLGLQSQTTYGLLSDLSDKKVKSMVNFLVSQGYAEITNSEYPVLKLTEQSKLVLNGNVTLEMKTLITEKEEIIRPTEYAVENENLLQELKSLRTKLAQKARVPAYLIFSNAALMDMARKCPVTSEEFLSVSGVGKVKQEKYGAKFIEVIKRFI